MCAPEHMTPYKKGSFPAPTNAETSFRRCVIVSSAMSHSVIGKVGSQRKRQDKQSAVRTCHDRAPGHDQSHVPASTYKSCMSQRSHDLSCIFAQRHRPHDQSASHPCARHARLSEETEARKTRHTEEIFARAGGHVAVHVEGRPDRRPP